MNRRAMRAAPALFTAVLVSGCVPYPVYKTLQPAAKLSVRGQGGQPLADAQATLIANAHPSRFEKRRETKMTLADGTASFDAVRELRVEMTALHGWEEFYWSWCIRKEGYATYLGPFQAELVVQLEAGAALPCPPARGGVNR
jgi:hypothetical protein